MFLGVLSYGEYSYVWIEYISTMVWYNLFIAFLVDLDITIRDYITHRLLQPVLPLVRWTIHLRKIGARINTMAVGDLAIQGNRESVPMVLT